MIDEIVCNLKKYFLSNDDENDNYKSSNFKINYNILNKYNNPDCLINIDKNKLKKLNPPMKYNKYQKTEKPSIKFHEIFDYKLNKLINTKNNLYDDVKNNKKLIEDKIINEISNRKNEKLTKKDNLEKLLNTIQKDNIKNK